MRRWPNVRVLEGCSDYEQEQSANFAQVEWTHLSYAEPLSKWSEQPG
jgi:hypothetical protein